MENSNSLVRTFQQLQVIDNLVGMFYAKEPTLKQSKFGYNYDRFHKKNYAALLKEFQDAIAYIRVENALEDEKTKEILTDEKSGRGYKYSKAGLKKCMEDEVKCIEKFNEKNITCEPFISPVLPNEMSESQTEILKGLLIA